jgi:hypothetical protein
MRQMATRERDDLTLWKNFMKFKRRMASEMIIRSIATIELDV